MEKMSSVKTRFTETSVVVMISFCISILFSLARVASAGSTTTNTNVNKEFLVGVYYYPWHNQNWGEFDDTTREHFHLYSGDYLRRQLDPPQYPVLGEYDDSKDATIDQHVEWCVYAGIGLWVTSWFGKDKHHDRTIRDVIIQNQKLIDNNIQIALHYETRNRIKETKDATDPDGTHDLSNVYPDMVHIAQTYFHNTNYLRIDDKPVIYIYVSRWLAANSQSQILDNVIDIMRNAASDVGYSSIYIVADQIWREAPTDFDNYQPFMWADAVTNYDSRNQIEFNLPHATQNDMKTFYEKQIDWHYAATNSTHDCHFIPSITPGFNKRGQGTLTKPALSRKLGSSNKPTGSFFEKMLLNALSITDSSTNNILMINSWNEWHEDSQIEPVGYNYASSNNTMSCTTEPELLTQGVEYCSYNYLYLNILRENIVFANESSCYGSGERSLIVANGDFESNLMTGSNGYIGGSWQPYPGDGNSSPTLTLITPGANSLSSTAMKVTDRTHDQDGLYQIHNASTCMFSIGQWWNIEGSFRLVDPITNEGVDCNPEEESSSYSCPMLKWVFTTDEGVDQITEFRVFDSSTNVWDKHNWNTFSVDIQVTPEMVHAESLSSDITYKSIWIGHGEMTSDLWIDDISYTRIYSTSKLPTSSELTTSPSLLPTTSSRFPTSSPSISPSISTPAPSNSSCVIDEDCGAYSYCHPRLCSDGICVDGEPPCLSGQECFEPECNPCSLCDNDRTKCQDTFNCEFDSLLSIDFNGIEFEGLCVGGINRIGKCSDECVAEANDEVPGLTCSDGKDNDCDGLIDSNDPDCQCKDSLAECNSGAECCSGMCRSDGIWATTCV